MSSKNKLRRIIAEELSGKHRNDNMFIRESIREIIIQEELQLEFLDKIKGAFGKIASGLKKIFVEGLPKAISALGTAFFSAVEGLLTFLGVDPNGLVMKSIRFIKESFLKFPENIANLISGISNFVVEKFTAAKTFITETIPEKFTEMQTKFIELV